MQELNPDMTAREAAGIIDSYESVVWDEYFDDFVRMGGRPTGKKVTLREIAPRQGFIAFVERGSSEGIYLSVKGLADDGVMNHVFTGKTLKSPDDPKSWDECWLSAGRISRALNEMRW